jgi:hypothetical protein
MMVFAAACLFAVSYMS